MNCNISDGWVIVDVGSIRSTSTIHIHVDIFIEQNKNIKDELKMRLVFPNEQEVEYIVPVMKYWEYDDKKIIEEKMYPLLPLQVFKLRYKMEHIKRKGNSTLSELTAAVLEAKSIAETIAREGKYMVAKKLLMKGQDLDTVLDVTELSKEEIEKLIDEIKDN